MSGFNVIVSLVGHRFTDVTAVAHEIRTHNCVDVPSVCRQTRIDIEYVPMKFTICCVRSMYVSVSVCASAFCMEETKLTDENEYEKRYERGVIVFDSFAASNLRLIEVED